MTGEDDGDIDADVIVVGAGLAGSCVAMQLAGHGLSVLVIEAGPGGPPRSRTRGERIRERLNEALGRPQPADVPHVCFYTREGDGGRLRPVLTNLGRGLGGSSALYAAALGRLRRSDFVAASRRVTAEPTLPTGWPIDYEEFLPYYHRAEALMRVRGECDPADADDDGAYAPPPPLAAAADRIRRTLLRNGLLPYRLHVAIDYVAGCRECFGFRCALACKGDGYNRALGQAVLSGRVTVEAGRTVERIEPPEGGRVRVVVADPGGARGVRTARRVVVAAGALNTPILLERSHDLWPEGAPWALGRGLMFHVSDLFVLGNDAPDVEGPRKWLCLRDFYDDGIVNLGEIQSLGVAIATGTVLQGLRARAAYLLGTWVRPVTEVLRPLAWAVARIVGPRPIYATIVEDMPHASNRVRVENGRIVAVYRADPMLVRRVEAMRKRVRAAFAPYEVHFLTRPGTPNWGHPVGTCRMGVDPATSVVDPSGRLHGHPEISVCDASSFPTSGGTGPSLTVIALALRAADRVAAELGHAAPARSRVAAPAI